MIIEEIRYLDWDGCVRLSNGSIDLIIPSSFGIRILHFALTGGQNRFAVFPHGSDADHAQWKLYGGHRFWIAPESSRSKTPDNEPVQIKELDNGVRVTQEPEQEFGIQKVLEVQLHPKKPQVTIRHRLQNHGPSTPEMAPWAITSFVPGGSGIVPLPKPKSDHDGLTAHGRLAIWPYTNLGVGQFSFDDQFVLLGSPTLKPQKIGLPCADGWCAYLHAGQLFIKSFHHDPVAHYPDQGSSAELYCDRQLIELETLGPLELCPTGSAVEHVETWMLCDHVPTIHDLPSFRDLVYPIIQNCLEII